MPQTDELQLLDRIAARDHQAFEQLYHLYYQRLTRFLYRFTRRAESIEEIVNDTMFVVWQNAAAFRRKSRVSTWIFGIAYRTALKELRRRGRSPEQESQSEMLIEGMGAPDPAVDRWELQRSLEAALATLSAEQRAVVELTYFHGYSCQEVADIVGCPVNTVKTRMFYARKRLRDKLPRLEAAHSSRLRRGPGEPS
ncbi:MAG: sigma-70 family RNA polymerase sigma factor [Acidobacteriota bacterium]|jgi:RNA polymerase sigma factor (sigma-70 family)